MDDVLGYAGKHVIVTGAASGMGEAAARLLIDVGALVTALDVKETALPVHRQLHVDLRDPDAITTAAAEVDGPVQAVFSVAGLPGPPFSDLDTITVNFIGARLLIESLLPKMAPGGAIVCVASNAGLGWQQELDVLLPFVSTPGFAEAVAWCEANPTSTAGNYAFSKKAINAWVAWRGTQLVADGIRLNCTNPGPTDTPMMPAFEALAGKELIDQFVGPSGRRSTPVEQAWPMLFVNSPRCTYVAGEAVHVDGGFLAAMVTGQLQV